MLGIATELQHGFVHHGKGSGEIGCGEAFSNSPLAVYRYCSCRHECG